MIEASKFGRRRFLQCACCTAAGLSSVGARAATGPDAGLPQALELGVPRMTRIAPTVWVGCIAPGVWLYTVTHVVGEMGFYPANGLIVERAGGALLVDTGYVPEQARVLLEWARDSGRPITQAVVTHFHSDRTGGIPALKQAGIRTLAHPMTWNLTRAHGLPEPEPIRSFQWDALALGPDVEMYLPGPGHTRDNLVVWLSGPKVLFGGCFLKSVTCPDLGYVADAVVPDWPASVERVRARYPQRAVVVPGHGSVAGDATAATLVLLAKA